MLSSLKLYSAIGVVLALVISHYWMYRQGVQTERSAVQREVIALREKEAELIQQIEQAKKEIKVVTNERIKIVKEASGSCLDERIPKPLLDSLHND